MWIDFEVIEQQIEGATRCGGHATLTRQARRSGTEKICRVLLA